jgi:hypothetical protein
MWGCEMVKLVFSQYVDLTDYCKSEKFDSEMFGILMRNYMDNYNSLKMIEQGDTSSLIREYYDFHYL